jgi:hypothetical protein
MLKQSISRFLKYKSIRVFFIKSRFFKEFEFMINELHIKRNKKTKEKDLVQRLE